MDPNATPANRFNELPTETQEFLPKLQKENIDLMTEGLKLVRAILTIGRFMKWVVIIFLSLVVGTVTLYDNLMKMWGWLHPGK